MPLSKRIAHVLLPLVFLLVLAATLLDIFRISLDPIWTSHAPVLRDGWTLSVDGQVVDPDFKIPVVLQAGDLTGRTVSISRTIPEDIPHLNSLMFRTSQKTVVVLVDGETVYAYDANLENRRLKMPGYINHFVWIEDGVQGKELTIVTVAHSARTSSTWYDVFIGSRVSQIGALFRYDGFSLIAGCLILLTALTVTVLAFTLFRKLEVFKSSLAFAGIEFCVGLWICGGSMSTQLLVHNQLVLLVCGVLAMFMLPVCLTWFVASMYHIPESGTLLKLVLVFPVAFVVISFLQLLGVTTYYAMLTPAAIVLFLYLLLLVFLCVRAYVRGNAVVRDFLVAIGCLMISVFGELILLLLPFMTLLNALVLNLGIIAFGLVLLRQILLLVMQFVEKKGRDEYLETLVHSDGLTGLSNRRAFDERMETIRRKNGSGTPVGMVVFDVNDLKKINDEQGHVAGDALLQTAATQLSDWFGTFGTIYRIGGDEFAMICETCSRERFEELGKRIGEALCVSGKCHLNLAYGSAMVGAEEGLSTVDDVFKAADAKMYKQKLEMKNGMIR